MDTTVYEQIASATGVAPDDVEKVLRQLGYVDGAGQLVQGAGAEREEHVNAQGVRVEIDLDKATIVK